MNKKIIGKILGYLLILEAAFMLPCLLISEASGESGSVHGFRSTLVLLLICGGALILLCHNAKREFQAREGFVTVGLAWILLPLFGGLPLWLAGASDNFVDCFFEITSGMTTTGASVFGNVEGLGNGINFWRCFTNWIGGMGILVFLLAIVPMGKTGSSMHLLRAESPGPSVGKLAPKMRQTAAILYGLYVTLTVLCIIFLLIAGMPLFDSICTALSTAGTGGFGIKNDSLAGYSGAIQNVVLVFMLLFGVNFSLYYLMIIRDLKSVRKNEEAKVFFGVVASATALIALNTRNLYTTVGSAIHHSLFTVSSIITTTGASTIDFDLWPQFSKSIILMLMISGAMAGSTGGGIKVVRLIIVMKSLAREVSRMLHPRRVKSVELNSRPLDISVVHATNTYLAAYCAIGVVSFIIISADNFSFETNFSAMLSCFNNIGPGFGMVGPTGNYAAFSNLSKIVLSCDMLLGRLEIFPLLALVSPSIWSKKKF